MYIANPVFDTFFKYMMQDKRCAKYFLETLLNISIKRLQFEPQEYHYKEPLKNTLMFYRLDFKALIETEEGKKMVLIELQKSSNFTDIMRFRNYIAENYKSTDQVIVKGKVKKRSLPIFTIFIFDFLIDYPKKSRVFKISHIKQDLETLDIYPKRSKLVEKLIHDGIVIQIPVPSQNPLSNIGQLLSIFDQKDFTDDTKRIKKYEIVSNNAEHNYLVRQLSLISQEPSIIDELEREEEAVRIYKDTTENFEEQLTEAHHKALRAIAIAEAERQQKEQAEKEKEQAQANVEAERLQKEQAEKEKEQAQANAEAERQQKEQAQTQLINSVIRQHKKGKSIADIADDMMLTEEQVLQMIRSNQWE